MFLITFYNKGKKICSCIKEGTTLEDAMLKAEFNLICKYSNIEYDNLIAEKIN